MRWATQDDEIEEGDTLKLSVAGALDAGTYTVRFDNGSGAVFTIEAYVSEGATYILVDTGDPGDDAGSGSYDIGMIWGYHTYLLTFPISHVNIGNDSYRGWILNSLIQTGNEILSRHSEEILGHTAN